MRKHMLWFVLAAVFIAFSLINCATEDPAPEEAESQSAEASTAEMKKEESAPMFAGHAKAEALQGPFETPMQVTDACLSCHQDVGDDFVQTVHWTWEGPSPFMAGHENEVTQGKMTTINNFCVAVDSNWARCTQCHAGYGWKDNEFDFANQSNIDCLVCHEQTGAYKKDPKKAGMPMEGTDLVASAQSVGDPSRANCGSCHFFAGGGNNVKKGDLWTAMIDPDESVDVHMGRLDFTCQSCHQAPGHEIQGSSLHIGLSTGVVGCTSCHSDDVHGNDTLNNHTGAVACQTCHIPAFSRSMATKVFWDWSKAGEKDADGNEVLRKDEDGNPIYVSKKGEFIWQNNNRPAYAWWNGTFNRMLVGDTYDEVPVDLGSPIGSIEDADSKIYPFKLMEGIQPADPKNMVLIVPHLFPSSAGPNAYWKMWDWDPSFEEGMAAAEVAYSGESAWVETYLYMAINHEIPPKSEALSCMDCHNGGIDFKALGYDGDPMSVGGRAKKM